MRKLIPLLLAVLCLSTISGQEQLSHEKKMYTGPDGKLYIQKDLPIYLWLSTDEEETSNMHRLESEETSAYANPMYLDTEGYNTVRSPSAVDKSTHETVYPVRDIIFEIYADSRAPVTSIDYGETSPYNGGGTLYLGSGTVITLSAKDALSGVENIYFSMNGSAYKPYTSPIQINEEKEYVLKYYAVDNVGNVEEVQEKKMIYDKTPPSTSHSIVGDQYENILSGRSKIELKTEDSGVGAKKIYYTIDDNPEKVYSQPILASYLSQADHKIVYYAEDNVGNKEQKHTYEFYVDKTPPTIIEEVMGKSFFSGGREYSSGKSRLKLTSFDNKAGVKEVRYSVNSGEYEVYDKPVFLTQSSGNLLIKSYAVDNVNNRSSSRTANEKTTIPYIDLTGPELGYTFTGPKFTTRDTTFITSNTKILLKSNDSEAGTNRIEYSLNGSSPVVYEEAFTVDREGYSEVDYTGYDNVENTTGNYFGFKVDNQGPEVTHTFGTTHLRSKDGVKIYPTHAVLFLSASDKVVGYNRMTYQLNGGSSRDYTGVLKGLPKGENTIEVTAYDNLGNITREEITFIIE